MVKKDEQQQLPGIDWSKDSRNYRKEVIEKLFARGDDAITTMFSGGTLGRTTTPFDYNDEVRSGRRRLPPTQEAVGLLNLTDIPISDLEAGKSPMSAVNTRNFLNTGRLGGAFGARAVQTGQIDYDANLPTSEKRATVTHELAHSLQSDLPKSTLEIELDKRKRELNIFDPSNKHSRRYDRPSGVNPEVQAVSWLASQTPASEGSAEGYRKKYQGNKASIDTSYSPEGFRDAYHVEGTTFGQDAADAYEAAHRFTLERGEVVKDTTLHSAAKLAGVLKSDLDEEGKRQKLVDQAASHRMATYLLHVAQGGHPQEHPHAEEYFNRRKAIEGEVVQQTMLPDEFPDINQFGQRATGVPERSPRGEALFAGQKTERSWKETADYQAREQGRVSRERYKNQPLPRFIDDSYSSRGDRRVSKYRVRLETAVKNTARRRELEAMTESNELHPEVENWLGKLVYDKKRDYARAYAMHRQSGGKSPVPELPQGLKDEHALSARTKIDMIFQKHRIGM